MNKFLKFLKLFSFYFGIFCLAMLLVGLICWSFSTFGPISFVIFPILVCGAMAYMNVYES